MLLNAVMVGCAKAKLNPKRDYLGPYSVTISTSHSLDNGPLTQPQLESGHIVVSGGSKPTTVIFTDDLGHFDVTLVEDFFSIPTQTNATTANTITTTATGKFTPTGFQFMETETETNKLFKRVDKREMMGINYKGTYGLDAPMPTALPLGC